MNRSSVASFFGLRRPIRKGISGLGLELQHRGLHRKCRLLVLTGWQKKQKQTAEQEEENSQSILDDQARVAEDLIVEEPAHLLDDDEKSIWSGFVTRNKQLRVCMMAYTVSGDNNEFYLPDRLYNLNVSLRATFEDVQKIESQG